MFVISCLLVLHIKYKRILVYTRSRVLVYEKEVCIYTTEVSIVELWYAYKTELRISVCIQNRSRYIVCLKLVPCTTRGADTTPEEHAETQQLCLTLLCFNVTAETQQLCLTLLCFNVTVELQSFVPGNFCCF